MPERFNPYAEWLGIPGDSARPDHYALLNLRPFEADLQAISLAAGAQMAKVRGVRPGAAVAEWGRVLDELAEAKRCLSDPAEKSRYDQELRQRLGSSPLQSELQSLAPPQTLSPDKESWIPNSDDGGFQAGRNLLPPTPTKSDNAAPQVAPQAISEPEESVTATQRLEYPSPPVARAASPPAAAAPAAAAPVPSPIPYSVPPAIAPPMAAVPPPPSISFGAGMAAFSLEALARLALVRGPVPVGGPIPMPNMYAGAMPVLTASALQLATPPAGRTATAASQSRRIGIAIAACAAIVIAIGTFAALKLTGRIGGNNSVATSAGSGNGPKLDNKEQANAKNSSGHENGSEPANSKSTRHPDDGGPPPKANTPQTPAPRIAPAPSKPPEKAVVLRFVPDAPPQPAPAVDPAQAARFRDTLTAIRQNLGQRKFAAAKNSADQATRQAKSPHQQATAERYGLLVKYVVEFWGAVHDAIEGLKVTDEIEVGETHWVVSEQGPDSLTIHNARSNRHYTIYELPSGLAVVLAERWLDPKKAANKVFIGAFYAVDPKSDPRDAKRIWGEAAAGGVDVQNLMPLLEPEPVEPTAPSPAMKTPQPNDQLAAPPSDDLLQRAVRRIREEFDDAYVAADSEGKHLELANKLLEAANETEDPTRRFVLWREARDQAMQSGHSAKMSDAVDRMARQFRIDALDMKTDLLEKNPPTNLPAARETTKVAVALVDAAIAANRLGLAARLAEAAVAASRQTQNAKLRAEATERSKKVETLLKNAPLQ